MAPFTRDGTENHMRWDGRSRGFMEAWYATLNHSDSGGGLWLRYTITAPRNQDPYAEVWGFYFDPDGKRSFGAKRRVPADRISLPLGRDDGALVRLGEAWLSERHLEGSVQRPDGRSLSWSLDFEPANEAFQHLPRGLRAVAERRFSVLCCPNLSVPFSGTVTLDGDELSLVSEPGCQAHRWGHGHPGSWSWAHCSRFDFGESAVFEGLAARSWVGPFPLPTMTFLFLELDGRRMAFNDPKWVRRARSRYEMPTWAFSARNDDVRIAGAGRALPDRMVQVKYEDPAGVPSYCVNSEIADLAIEVYERSGATWRHTKSLTATRTAHLEFGRRERFVEMPVEV